jgi:hypothetical protein
VNDAYDVRTRDDDVLDDDHQRDGEDGSDRGDTTIRGENSSHDGHDVYANGGFISRRIGIIIFFIW